MKPFGRAGGSRSSCEHSAQRARRRRSHRGKNKSLEPFSLDLAPRKGRKNAFVAVTVCSGRREAEGFLLGFQLVPGDPGWAGRGLSGDSTTPRVAFAYRQGRPGTGTKESLRLI